MSREHHVVALELVDVLREYGVDRVFGIPGGAISPMYAMLAKRPDISIVTAKHESGAAFMAMGYARATGRPGVVITTAGPGITNAITGMASAFYEGSPVVMIAGEVPRSAFGRGALQEGSPAGFDAVALLRRVTKFSVLLAQPGSATALLRKAITTAFSGRQGPVFVSLPLDVAMAKVPSQPIAGSVQSTFAVDEPAAQKAFDALMGAERALIIAGSGARDLTSRRMVRRLAEYVGCPVAVTTKAKGVFPEDHPSYLGILGFGGHDSVIDYLTSEVDVILAVGSGLNDFTTNAWTPLLRARKAFIQIDIDSAQIGRNYPVDLGLLGPADAVIGRMLDHRTDEPRRANPPVERLRRQPVEPSAIGRITTTEVVLTMNEVCPRDSVFTADMGEHLAIALHYLCVRESGDFITNLGFGSMGSGIVSAIGFQMGAPQRRTFAICGDGGFLMFGGELATAVHEKVAVTFVIINDERLNMVHHGMIDLYGATPDFGTGPVDFAHVAKGFGAVGRVVHTKHELVEALELRAAGPVVIDVRVDPEVRLRSSRNAALRQFQSDHG